MKSPTGTPAIRGGLPTSKPHTSGEPRRRRACRDQSARNCCSKCSATMGRLTTSLAVLRAPVMALQTTYAPNTARVVR
jgi:hypothetical protein